jgi:hypothetical protein
MNNLTISDLNDSISKKIKQATMSDKELKMPNIHKHNKILAALFMYITVMAKSYELGKIVESMQNEEKVMKRV